MSEPGQQENTSEIVSRYQVAEKTEASIKHPERNEDSLISSSEHGYIGVFDGVGGLAAGAQASQIAAGKVATALQTLPNNPTKYEVREAFKKGHLDTLAAVEEYENTHPEAYGMATTASVIQIAQGAGKRYAGIMHTGDSRAYRVNKNYELEQLTTDHSSVWSDWAKGDSSGEEAREINNFLDEMDESYHKRARGADKSLTKKAEDYFRRRNVVQRIFTDKRDPDIEFIQIQEGDRYIFATSDGVHDNLTRSEIEEIVKGAESSEQLVERLVKKAKEVSTSDSQSRMRAKPDDISAVALLD